MSAPALRRVTGLLQKSVFAADVVMVAGMIERACEEELQVHAPALTAAEQGNLAAAALPEHAAGAEAVPAGTVSTDHWVACSRCDKWRLVSPDMIPDPDAAWYCEMRPGTSCRAPADPE